MLSLVVQLINQRLSSFVIICHHVSSFVIICHHLSSCLVSMSRGWRVATNPAAGGQRDRPLPKANHEKRTEMLWNDMKRLNVAHGSTVLVVFQATSKKVLGGNYSFLKHLFWKSVVHICWLDFPKLPSPRQVNLDFGARHEDGIDGLAVLPSNVEKTMPYITHLGMVYTTCKNGDLGDGLFLFYPH